MCGHLEQNNAGHAPWRHGNCYKHFAIGPLPRVQEYYPCLQPSQMSYLASMSQLWLEMGSEDSPFLLSGIILTD